MVTVLTQPLRRNEELVKVGFILVILSKTRTWVKWEIAKDSPIKDDPKGKDIACMVEFLDLVEGFRRTVGKSVSG